MARKSTLPENVLKTPLPGQSNVIATVYVIDDEVIIDPSLSLIGSIIVLIYHIRGLLSNVAAETV